MGLSLISLPHWQEKNHADPAKRLQFDNEGVDLICWGADDGLDGRIERSWRIKIRAARRDSPKGNVYLFSLCETLTLIAIHCPML